MTIQQVSIAQRWALIGHFLAITGGACFTIAGILELLEKGRLPMYPADRSRRPEFTCYDNDHI